MRFKLKYINKILYNQNDLLSEINCILSIIKGKYFIKLKNLKKFQSMKCIFKKYILNGKSNDQE